MCSRPRLVRMGLLTRVLLLPVIHLYILLCLSSLLYICQVSIYPFLMAITLCSPSFTTYRGVRKP